MLLKNQHFTGLGGVVSNGSQGRDGDYGRSLAAQIDSLNAEINAL